MITSELLTSYLRPSKVLCPERR